ncbi:hypothetical protein JCM10914A_49920 [Paenibacillus sp. JCM 10914]
MYNVNKGEIKVRRFTLFTSSVGPHNEMSKIYHMNSSEIRVSCSGGPHGQQQHVYYGEINRISIS